MALEQIEGVLRDVFPHVPGLHYAKDLLAGSQCYESLFVDVHLTDVDCLKLLLSKLLSLVMLVSGPLVKLPQVYVILSKQSAQGLSLESVVLGLLCYIVSAAYNYRNQYPFSTYGETVFIALQDAIIVSLIFWFGTAAKKSKPNLTAFAIFPVVIAAFVYVLFEEAIVSKEILFVLQYGSIVLINASKLPQLYLNYSQGSTGNLSAITTILFSLGALARVFTTIQEVNDPVILAGFLAGAVINFLLALQIVLYWGKAPASSDSGKKDTKKDAAPKPQETKQAPQTPSKNKGAPKSPAVSPATKSKKH